MNRRQLYTIQRRGERAAPAEFKTIPSWGVLVSMKTDELEAMAVLHGIDVAGKNRFKVAGELNDLRKQDAG